MSDPRDELAALLYESLAADEDTYVLSMGGPSHTTIDGTIDLIAAADRIIAAGWVFDGSCRDCQANLSTNGGQHMFHCRTPEGKAQWAEDGDEWPTATN